MEPVSVDSKNVAQITVFITNHLLKQLKILYSIIAVSLFLSILEHYI